jgi:hypothetical protein
MAFPNLYPKSANISMAINVAQGAADVAGAAFTLSPTKQIDGTPWDASLATSATITVDNGSPGTGYSYSSVALANATSAPGVGTIAITSTAAQMKTAFNPFVLAGTTRGNISITLSDGTNDVLVAQGQWNANLLP